MVLVFWDGLYWHQADIKLGAFFYIKSQTLGTNLVILCFTQRMRYGSKGPVIPDT